VCYGKQERIPAIRFTHVVGPLLVPSHLRCVDETRNHEKLPETKPTGEQPGECSSLATVKAQTGPNQQHQSQLAAHPQPTKPLQPMHSRHTSYKRGEKRWARQRKAHRKGLAFSSF
jgi:hypothetical protein